MGGLVDDVGHRVVSAVPFTCVEGAPDPVHPHSGGHSCCAAENRRNFSGAVLGGLGEVVDMPEDAQQQAPG